MIYPINFNMSGMFLMIFVYIYLYVLYRESYMGIWLISWLIYLCRSIFLDSGMFNWMQSPLGIALYQIVSSIAALMFTYGTLFFINKKSNKYWLYGAVNVFLLNMVFIFFHSSFLYAMLPSTWFCGIVYIWAGIIFIRYFELPGVGRLITGYAFILLGIHTLNKPFLVSISWIAPWGYLIADSLRLTIAAGTLLVYFEKTRIDLVKKETHYRLLAENAIDVIYRYCLLPEPKLEYISPSVFMVSGYTPEEFYADPELVYKLIHTDDLALYKKFISTSPRSNDTLLTFRMLRRDQCLIWIELKYTFIYDKTGNIIAREGIFRDVTSRKELEQLAAKNDRLNMVGQMATNVAHEIRNPLTTVRGYLQIMCKKANFIEKEHFDVMIEELDRTNSIISEYLLLAKDKRPELKVCNLNTIIKKLFPLLQAYASAFNIAINLDLKNIPNQNLDENEIRQLLLNLVRNGIEAMPKGGKLSISTRVNNKIILSIRDQGAGIPIHILENLGMPFLTNKDMGTGLGLSMCYRIANRHNATIDVKTGSKGTTFFIYFESSFVA